MGMPRLVCHYRRDKKAYAYFDYVTCVVVQSVWKAQAQSSPAASRLGAGDREILALPPSRLVRSTAMIFTISDYRQFSQECIVSARLARSEELRKHFLDLAKMWATAAANHQGATIPELVQDTVG
jgi:hypothetical protein